MSKSNTKLKALTTRKSKGLERYQASFPKNSSISKRIGSLLSKYEGMDFSEIVKLAIITLDNEKPTILNERLPDKEELERIQEYIRNPKVLSPEESKSFLDDLRTSI